MAFNPFLREEESGFSAPGAEGVNDILPQWKAGQTPKTTPTASSVYGDWLTGNIKDSNYFYNELIKKQGPPGAEGSPNDLVERVMGKNTWDRYQKVVSVPEKISVQELLTKHPDAKYWSDATIQAFADNYRLGLASLNSPLSEENWNTLQKRGYVPAVEGNKYSIDYAYTGDKYNAIKDPKQIIFDPVYGLITPNNNKTAAKQGSTGLIGGVVDSFGSSPLPTLALLASVAAPALLGGQAAAGGTAGATTGGATGLSSLPSAGTWAQTAAPALGAGAGSWTLPSALTGIPGATVAAGGLTLGNAISASPGLGGTTLGGAAAASSSSITDWLGNVFNQGVDKFMSDPITNTLNLVGGVSSYLGQKDQAKDLENLLKQGLSQSDPFGSQRAYYMDRLKSTYTNPESYLKSPEYSAISKRRLEALERADAAQGRRSQYGARAEKMHEFDLENLNKERAMLAQLAGSGINPSQVSSLLGSLGTGSATAQANAPGNLLFMLNEIFGSK